jgi:colicin import membrane protein
VTDEGAPRAKPRQPGRIRAVLLALAVHAAFFGLIVFGVTWQNRPAPPLEAELWKDLPPVKAAKSADPAPAPAPEPVKPEPPKPEPPKPEPPKPEPPKPRPEPAKAEPPRPDPAIAEKREREKKEKDKVEKEKVEKQKAEEDKARVARTKAEAEAKAAAEAVAASRQNEVNLYRGRIRDKIRGRANVPDTVTGKPEVEVRITLLPGGEVLDIKLVKSSGNRIYDEAILRAVRSASPLPVPPANSELFPQFRDLILKIEHER